MLMAGRGRGLFGFVLCGIISAGRVGVLSDWERSGVELRTEVS